MEYIERYYCKFEDLQQQGLDALIITGANVANPSLEQEPFWEPLMEVVRWADKNVSSTLCSCLATHALLKYLYGIDRQPLPAKRWGVYNHRIAQPGHPLLRDINTRFDVPHSRFNEISRQQLEDAGLTVLVEGREGGVHMAVSPDQFRMIYFQGHPEYDRNSLLKEYKRELLRYLAGDLDSPPPLPQHYFSDEAKKVANRFIKQSKKAQEDGQPTPDWLEEELLILLDNTWGDTAKAMVNNWLGLVYQVTNLDRNKQFMDEVDPDDPLHMKG